MRDLLLPWVCYACIHTHFNGPLFGTTQVALEKRQLNGCCRSSNFGAICLLVLFMFFFAGAIKYLHLSNEFYRKHCFRVDQLSMCTLRPSYRVARQPSGQHAGLGAEGPGFKSQPLRCLVTRAVHTHCASVHQAAKLVAALLRVAGVTAGLAESNGSLPPGL